MSLKGKVYALTGGASGIGFATAKVLAKRGATVSIADIDPDAMSTATAYFDEQGTEVLVSRVDVSQRPQVEDWLDATVEKYGRLDGAANVAGIIGKHHGLRAVAELEDEEWHKIIATEAPSSTLLLSMALRAGFAKHGAYDASKHGIVGLTRAAAKENGHREVRVNAVAPGAIYTPLMKKAWDMHNRPEDAAFDEPTAFQRQGTSEECASVIAFLLGPESTFVSGSVYEVDGAWI
ncbi:D-arabinitol 2-dehydrogenase [Fusarium sp. NRRL 25303]|nr:D-arabinitol 2-dehydrogenase [Fusarium sp. NRRL 25303]